MQEYVVELANYNQENMEGVYEQMWEKMYALG